MKSLKIKSIQEGMVTATDIKDRMGRILITSGKVITAQNLKTLKAWGVTDVHIEDSAMPEDSLQKTNEIKASPHIIKEQEALFKFSDRRHPAVAELYDICLARKVQTGLDN